MRIGPAPVEPSQRTLGRSAGHARSHELSFVARAVLVQSELADQGFEAFRLEHQVDAVAAIGAYWQTKRSFTEEEIARVKTMSLLIGKALSFIVE